MKTNLNSNNKIRKNNSKPKQKRPLTSQGRYKINQNILASDEAKKYYQKLNAYPNYKFIKQLNTEKLVLFLNNYNPADINIISKILPKYFYFQQITIGAFEQHQTQPQNIQQNFNNQKKRNSKSLGKIYKNQKQKESEKIQIKQKIFSAFQKHLSQSKSLLSLVIQSFKINQDMAKYLSKGISENKSLQYFSLNYNVIPVDMYEIILKGLLTHEIIRCIDLSNNKLNDKYSPMISRIIQRQSQRRDQVIWSYQLRNELPNNNNYKIGLISINLHGNQLGKQSAEIISNVLSNDQYIRYIDLSKNFFDNSACKLFIHMMRKNNTLLTVDLRENAGYDEFINPRIVMKMSKNIKFLYSQYQNGQYTEDEFQYLKGFIDISFFDVDIPQEIVEYYNTNVQQTTDANPPIDNNNIINNNINNIKNNEIQNINNNINNNNIINENNEQEEIEEELGVIKNNSKNIKNMNMNIQNNKNYNNINNINKIIKNNSSKNDSINKTKKDKKALKENQKLIQENLQLKQEILELKAKNLQKMLADGLVVPQEEEKDLEIYYNRANEIIDTLNEVMAKLQKHKEENKNNIQNDINDNNLNNIKNQENNIINNIPNNFNIDNSNNNSNKKDIIKNNNNKLENNNQNKNDMNPYINKNINQIKSNDENNINIDNRMVNNNININNDINNNIITNNIENNNNNNIINNSGNNINKENNKNNNNNIKDINIDKNFDDKNKLSGKDKKEKENPKIIEDKNEGKLNENNIDIKNQKNEKQKINLQKREDDNHNINLSDEDEENDFNFDDLTEEEKIALIQKREILLKLQEEAEARGENFDIQEYLAQLEEQGEEDDEEFEHHGQNNNKLNKSF